MGTYLERAESEEDLSPARTPVDEVSVENIPIIGTWDSVDGEDREKVLKLPMDISDDGHLSVLLHAACLSQA